MPASLPAGTVARVEADLLRRATSVEAAAQNGVSLMAVSRIRAALVERGLLRRGRRGRAAGKTPRKAPVQRFATRPKRRSPPTLPVAPGGFIAAPTRAQLMARR